MSSIKAAEFIAPIVVGITGSLLIVFTSLNPFVSLFVVLFVYVVGLCDGLFEGYRFWKEQ